MSPTAAPAASYRPILIGIDNYSARPLGGCVNDIDQVEDLLLERLRVPPERITRLTAPRPGLRSTARLPSTQPTLAALRGCLEELAQTATAEDRVFLYYSGHGGQAPTRVGDLVVMREALVPVDVGTPAGGWLYDFEINALLARIAARAADLTLVLDCCHSGSVTRDADDHAEEHVRFYGLAPAENSAPATLSAPGPPSPARDGSGAAVADGATGLGAGEAPWMVVAACRANELAREVPMSQAAPDRYQGALTHVLIELLRGVEPSRLSEIRWAEVWPALLDKVDRVSSLQHPYLLGRGERRVFGGRWAPRDLGYLVRADRQQRRVEIGAGFLTGVTPGAMVGIYGPAPDRFPPLGSAADLAARRGLVRIASAKGATALGELVGGFEIPAEARARLIEPGPADCLIVAIEPPDPVLARQIEPLGAAVLPPGEPASSAELELRREGADIVLCDAVHDDRQVVGTPHVAAPLLRIAGGHAQQLERALRHYARYNQVLRLVKRCQDLPGALRVTLRACPDPASLGAADLADPQLQELQQTPAGAYVARQGTPFVIRVHNTSAQTLHTWAFNCAGSGRVELLGKETLAPASPRTFWQHGRVGEPFAPAVGTGSTAIVDRLVLVATNNAAVDLDYLELPQAIADASRTVTRDALSDATPPVEAWTAVQVSLVITLW
jgi:hypothetical protein